MSCYAKHPDNPGVECWHGPGHDGDHGKENHRWPNAEDPLRKEIGDLRIELAAETRQHHATADALLSAALDVERVRHELANVTRLCFGAEQAAETANAALVYYKDKAAKAETERDRFKLACDTFEQSSAISLSDANAAEAKTRALIAERDELLAVLRTAKPSEYGEAATEWRRQKDAVLAKYATPPPAASAGRSDPGC